MRVSGRVKLIYFFLFLLIFEIELRPQGDWLAGIGLGLHSVLLVIISCNMIGLMFILTLGYSSD